jgi:uncharacterized membrane protein YphA (DoxX/SURF4 family)
MTGPSSKPEDRVVRPLAIVLRILVGAVFIALGWKKLGDPVAFLKAIKAYELVGAEHYVLLNSIAATLPVLEIVIGICLVLGIARRGAAFVAFVMLAVFSYAVYQRGVTLAAEQGTELCAIAFDCGCGTGVEKVCSKLAQNAALLVAAAYVAYFPTMRIALRDRLVAARSA